jgi:hypothetical protein
VHIAAAAGTVHVSYEAGGVLHYARRVGTAWTDRVVTDVVGQHAMAIDTCGSPHFAVWTGVPPTMTRYYRWTPAGWRSGDFADSGCAFGDGLDIAITSASAFVSFYDCPFQLATIPLR